MLKAGVSGRIRAHDHAVNLTAIKKMLQLEPYYTFGIKSVEKAVKNGLNTEEVVAVMADSLGITVERFSQAGPGFIEPRLTIKQFESMLDAIDGAIVKEQQIIMGTGHPGSLLQFYLRLSEYIRRRKGKLFNLPGSVRIEPNYWVDAVGAVIVISDLGGLNHSHERLPMQIALEAAGKVGLAIADHGFAGAAIDAGIKTVALHDVDDPAIPMAKFLGADIVLIPMNDNRLNVSTDQALQAVIQARL